MRQVKQIEKKKQSNKESPAKIEAGFKRILYFFFYATKLQKKKQYKIQDGSKIQSMVSFWE